MTRAGSQVRFVDPADEKTTYVGFVEQSEHSPPLPTIFDAGVQTTNTNYDPTADAYWRFSESDGGLSWDTSPDGSTWTSRFSLPTPSFADAGLVRFAVGQTDTVDGGSTVTFSDLQ